MAEKLGPTCEHLPPLHNRETTKKFWAIIANSLVELYNDTKAAADYMNKGV